MRILITGGEGQLGRALHDALAGEEVFALGHTQLDITDERSIAATFEEARPEVVLHAAAWTDTAGCENDPERARRVNGEGPGLVAAACATAGAAMVYVSSNEVFDGEKGEPYKEDDPPKAINEYGRSKLEGERRVRAQLDRHYIVRTSWLYGPGRVSFPEKIVQAAQQQGRLTVVTDEIASPTWTVDLARAIASLIRQPAWGTYHLTNAGACSRLEWAREVLRLSGMTEVPITPATLAEFGGPYRKPKFSALANTHAAGLGIELRGWREALADHFARAAGDARPPASTRPVR